MLRDSAAENLGKTGFRGHLGARFKARRVTCVNEVRPSIDADFQPVVLGLSCRIQDVSGLGELKRMRVAVHAVLTLGPS
jgi:hypothetical protein